MPSWPSHALFARTHLKAARPFPVPRYPLIVEETAVPPNHPSSRKFRTSGRMGKSALIPTGTTIAVVGMTIAVAGMAVAVAGMTIAVVGTAVAVAGMTIAVAGMTIAVAGTAVAVVGTTIAVVGTTIAVAGTAIAVVGTAVAVAGMTIAVAGMTIAVAGNHSSSRKFRTSERIGAHRLNGASSSSIIFTTRSSSAETV